MTCYRLLWFDQNYLWGFMQRKRWKPPLASPMAADAKNFNFCLFSWSISFISWLCVSPVDSLAGFAYLAFVKGPFITLPLYEHTFCLQFYLLILFFWFIPLLMKNVLTESLPACGLTVMIFFFSGLCIFSIVFFCLLSANVLSDCLSLFLLPSFLTFMHFSLWKQELQ